MTRIFLLLMLGVAALGCTKNEFITSPDAYLSTSTDTLHFDTVFTTTGSITQSFKIFNPNDGKLRLSKVELAGGSSSPFRLNIDGTPGTAFSDVEIEAGDSIYAFVTVTINPNSSTLPFLVRDSIAVSWNGKTRYVQLDAFGRNAHFLRNRRITSDTSWNNDLPYVIIGALQVDPGRTLTISKGAHIYVHADAPIIVDGTIKAIGEKFDSTRIVFQGDRLDDPYRNYPGSWPGIVFRTSSRDNELQFVTIHNAYQGVVAQNPAVGSNPKLILNECIFHNIYDVAVGGVNSSIDARNCQITQSGYNVFLVGGNYYFNHCTIASYGSYFLQHKNPVMVLSDISGASPVDLTALIRNTIIYGEGGNVDDEILVNRKAPSAVFNVQFDNVLYKMKSADPAGCTFTGTKIRNQPPGFDSVNTSKPFYNFRLRAGSTAVDGAGTTGIPPFDLDGNPRITGAAPDLGAYERQ